MARATLDTVRRQVFDNLGVTLVSTGYGTLDATNQRYLDGYIDDKIAEADIDTIMLLFKNKQHNLLRDLYVTQTSMQTGDIIPNNWIVVDVTIGGEAGVEIPYGQFEQLNGGGIYDVSTYGGYYSIRDGRLYYIHPTNGAGAVTYIDVTHPSTLSSLLCPSGFEGALSNLASSILLMKRADKPQQSEFYKGLYDQFMQAFIIPDTNVQDFASD